MRPIRIFHIIWFIVIVLAPWSIAARETENVLTSALRSVSQLSLCGEAVPLSDPQVLERFEKEMLVSLGDRPQVILWLKRSTRFFPYIEKALQDAALPDDIKYLAVAESALRLHAGSVKGAMGVWQMMPQTARKYGLEVSSRFDERRNIYMSTAAALTYLKALYAQFGSWSLALAAYNMGEEGLTAEILEQGTEDYYRLYLSTETQRFIFRILAIKQIMTAPEQYGFDLLPDEYYAPETFGTVEVTADDELPIRLIAQAAGTDFMAIKALNPELRGHYLAAGTRRVNIPENGGTGFAERLAALVETETANSASRIYVVQAGDNLSMIAETFEVPLAALLIWNRIDIDRAIQPGQRLVVSPPAGNEEPSSGEPDGDAEP
jgi:LysM repeat protein